MNFFSALGTAIIGPAVQDVTQTATDAYYVLVGIELLILVALVLLVLREFHVL